LEVKRLALGAEISKRNVVFFWLEVSYLFEVRALGVDVVYAYTGTLGERFRVLFVRF
jgi:hypothetical protein